MTLQDGINITASLITIGLFVWGIYKWIEYGTRSGKAQGPWSYPYDPVKIMWRWGLGMGAIVVVLGVLAGVFSVNPGPDGQYSPIQDFLGYAWIFSLFLDVPVATCGTMVQTRDFGLCVGGGFVAAVFSDFNFTILYLTAFGNRPPMDFGSWLGWTIGWLIAVGIAASVVGGITRLVIYLVAG